MTKQPYNCAYKGKCPIKKGDKVRVLVCEKPELWVDGKVVTPCATQFTAMVAKHIVFLFYTDRGNTWEIET